MTNTVRDHLVFEQHYGCADDWPPSNAAGFIAWLQAKLMLVPEEYRESAGLEIEPAEVGDSDLCIRLYWDRPQTEEEAAAARKAGRDRLRDMWVRDYGATNVCLVMSDEIVSVERLRELVRAAPRGLAIISTAMGIPPHQVVSLAEQGQLLKSDIFRALATWRVPE